MRDDEEIINYVPKPLGTGILLENKLEEATVFFSISMWTYGTLVIQVISSTISAKAQLEKSKDEVNWLLKS